MMKLMITGVVALALVAGACGGDKPNPQPTAETAAPSPPPTKSEAVTKVADMEVMDLDALRADIAKAGAKVTVVALWATWCTPCIEEMPLLAKLYEAHKAHGLRVVGLCTDDREDIPDKIQQTLDRTKVPYKQALLKPGEEDALLKGLGETWDGQLPKTIVVDASGKKLEYFKSAVTEELLKEKVVPLLQ